MKNNKKICKLGLWNDSVPGIIFDSEGVSNYAKIQYNLIKDYPRSDKGRKYWDKIITEIKLNSKKNSKYDCIVGVSGGTDSSYLLHIAKKYNLNPLAINLDNGWNSELAVNNINNLVKKLGVDLYTHVIDWKENKDLQRSFLYQESFCSSFQ